MATQYIQDQEGSTFIPASQRPDGTWRKPRKVKQGFVPQEEVPLYESKGKKIAKEAQASEGLPVGVTKEQWEKMKEAQAKLLNPQQKATKKKNNKKKSTNQTVVSNDQNENDNQLNNIEQTTTAATKKKKNKNKQTNNNENNGTIDTSSVSPSNATLTNTPVADDWVTMGKAKPTKKSSTNSTATSNSLDKATSAVENLRLDNKKSGKQQSVTNKKRIDQLAVSKGVDELANDMLIDEDHDDDNEEQRLKEKNNEKQQLVKKIKTLKKKLKDVDTLKELGKQKSLDDCQKEKISKAEQFSKDLIKLQAKLDQIVNSK